MSLVIFDCLLDMLFGNYYRIIWSLRYSLPPGKILFAMLGNLGPKKSQAVLIHIAVVKSSGPPKSSLTPSSPLFLGRLDPKVESEPPVAPVLACFGFNFCSPSPRGYLAQALRCLRTSSPSTARGALVWGSSFWVPILSWLSSLKGAYSLGVYICLAFISYFHQEGRSVFPCPLLLYVEAPPIPIK